MGDMVYLFLKSGLYCDAYFRPLIVDYVFGVRLDVGGIWQKRYFNAKRLTGRGEVSQGLHSNVKLRDHFWNF